MMKNDNKAPKQIFDKFGINLAKIAFCHKCLNTTLSMLSFLQHCNLLKINAFKMQIRKSIQKNKSVKPAVSREAIKKAVYLQYIFLNANDNPTIYSSQA